MKNIVQKISVLMLCVSILSCSQPKKPTGGFQIQGATSIKSTMIYLKNEQDKIIDSSKISGHKFVFYGKVTQPAFYSFSIKDYKQETKILLENDDYEITIAKNNHIIIGGTLNEKFTGYKNELTDIENRKLDYLKLQVSAYPDKVKELQHHIDSMSLLERATKIKYIDIYHDNNISTYIIKNDIDTYVDIHTLYKIKSSIKTAKNEALINALISTAIAREKKRSKKAVNKKITTKKVRLQPSPMFSGEALQGGDLSLQSIIKGKKAVIVDFWASWCGPCKQITPILKRLHNKYKNKGFTIITISEDKTREAWRNGVISEGMSDWNHIFDDYMRIAYMFNVTSIPHMVLLDGNGTIIINKISSNDLETEIQKLIN